ncbi:MAG: hypothetical protein M0P34_06005 [Desulfocurvus sp.]|nr:hypothetical protein [Desulfocurvus sp.]MCK9239915.1 hypothetical protein [Desulfocurvus sp.]
MDAQARHRLTKARAELVMDHPFFAHLALRLDLREDPGCASAWSDGRTLGYNPAYVRALTPAMTKGLLCHEVLHLACGHHLHRGRRDPGLWNMACDYAINPVLREAGLTLPPGFLDDPAHHGRGADAIYAALAARHDETRAAALGGRAQAAQAPAEQPDAGSPGQESPAAGQGGGGGTGDDPPRPGQDGPGAAGGSAGGQDPADPGQGGDPGMSGEVRDAPAPPPGGADSAQALERERESWRTSLAQALHKARQCGGLPGGLERLLGRARAGPWAGASCCAALWTTRRATISPGCGPTGACCTPGSTCPGWTAASWTGWPWPWTCRAASSRPSWTPSPPSWAPCWRSSTPP